jgi:hypothetical protein
MTRIFFKLLAPTFFPYSFLWCLIQVARLHIYHRARATGNERCELLNEWCLDTHESHTKRRSHELGKGHPFLGHELPHAYPYRLAELACHSQPVTVFVIAFHGQMLSTSGGKPHLIPSIFFY